MAEQTLRDEMRFIIREIMIDPERLEFGHKQVNLRVGATCDRMADAAMAAAKAYANERVRKAEERVLKYARTMVDLLEGKDLGYIQRQLEHDCYITSQETKITLRDAALDDQKGRVCPTCYGNGYTPTSCPDKRPGCLVLHGKKCHVCHGTGKVKEG